MGKFGYRLVEAVAAMVLVTDVTEVSSLWQPIFDIGPKGHHAIEHFFLCFLIHLNEGTDPVSFVARWRPMIEAVMAGCGWEGGPWYHQQTLERHALGFAQPDAIARPSAAASLVESMRDLYRAWALKRCRGMKTTSQRFADSCRQERGRHSAWRGLFGSPMPFRAILWIDVGTATGPRRRLSNS
jgi:hypothetical protein